MNFFDATVTVTVDTRGLPSQLAKVTRASTNAATKAQQAFDRMANRVIHSVKRMAKIAIASFTAMGVAAIKWAADVKESEHLFEFAMGEAADATREWSEELATALKRNQYDIRRTTATLNVLLTTMGITSDEAAEMSRSMVRFSYDMAALRNMAPEEVFEKLKSGIVGFSRPMRALGISTIDTSVKMFALAHGIGTVGEELTETEKMIARYGIMMQTARKIQGYAISEIDYAVSVYRSLKDQVRLIAIAIGNEYLPAITEAGIALRDYLIENQEKIIAQLTEMIDKLGEVAAALWRYRTVLVAVGIATGALVAVKIGAWFYSALTILKVLAATIVGATVAFYAQKVAIGIWAKTLHAYMIITGKDAVLVGLSFKALVATITASIMVAVKVVLVFAAIAYVLRAAWKQNITAIKNRMEWVAKIFKSIFTWIANSVIGRFFVWMAERIADMARNWKEFFADLMGLGASMTAWIQNIHRGPTAAAEAAAAAYVDAYESAMPKLEAFEKFTVETFKTGILWTKAFGEATAEHLGDLWTGLKAQIKEDMAAITGWLAAPEVAEIVKPPEAPKDTREAELRARLAELARLQEETQAKIAEVNRKIAERAKVAAIKLATEEIEAIRYMHWMTRMEKIQYLQDYLVAYKEAAGTILEIEEMIKDEIKRLDRSRIDQLKVYYAELRENMQERGRWLADSFANAFRRIQGSASDMFYDIMTHAENWQDALENLFKNIVRAFVRMIADMLAEYMMFKTLTGLGLGYLAPGGGGAATTGGGEAGQGTMAWSGYKPSAQYGGTVVKTGAIIAHKGETFSGVGGGGTTEVRVVYTGRERHEVSSEQSIGALNQHILTINMQAMEGNMGYQNAMKRAVK